MLTATAILLSILVATTQMAAAQVDYDLSCNSSASIARVTSTFVSVEGDSWCGRAQDRISVSVCLLLDGIPVTCATETAENSAAASAYADFPCVPGVWSAVAIGTASNGRASLGYSVPVLAKPGECDPLQPRP